VDKAFVIKTAASAVGIALLVALAAWARIARPTPSLDEAAIRDLLAFDFPGAPLGPIWISADGRGAIVRSGQDAFIIFPSGDSYIARAAPWSRVADIPAKDGVVDLRSAVGAPRIRFQLGGGAAWPPGSEATA